MPWVRPLSEIHCVSAIPDLSTVTSCGVLFGVADKLLPVSHYARLSFTSWELQAGLCWYLLLQTNAIMEVWFSSPLHYVVLLSLMWWLPQQISTSNNG